MPELPDVEIARQDLGRWVVGATVTAAYCGDPYLARPTSPRVFERTLVGRTVDSVQRKGKWLRLVLDDGGRLFSHLGMTGEWVHVAIDAPEERFERARIDVTRGGRSSSVRYIDTRRFGRLIAARRDVLEWTSLGPDPVADGIDLNVLSKVFAERRRPVKEILMDQRVLAGIGNILATESLWIARVDPRSLGRSLRPGDVRAIARGIRRAIGRELARRRRHRTRAADSFFVYGHAGEPCPRCGTQLESITLGGRTTVLCRRCQVYRRQER